MDSCVDMDMKIPSVGIEAHKPAKVDSPDKEELVEKDTRMRTLIGFYQEVDHDRSR